MLIRVSVKPIGHFVCFVMHGFVFVFVVCYPHVYVCGLLCTGSCLRFGLLYAGLYLWIVIRRFVFVFYYTQVYVWGLLYTGSYLCFVINGFVFVVCYSQVNVCGLLYAGLCLCFVINRFVFAVCYTQVCVCGLLYTGLCL